MSYKNISRYFTVSVSSLLLIFTFIAQAKRPEYNLKIENHLFYPAKITIPANKKVKLIIANHDATIEEFDSFSLNREKVIFPKQQAIIFIGPLPEGEYSFIGEYHPHSARGKVIVENEITTKFENGAQNVN